MKQKKTQMIFCLVCLVCVMLCILALSACAPKDGNPDTTESGEPSGEIIESGNISSGDTQTPSGDGNEHKHTFSTEYSKNESEHWKEATCGHNVEIERNAHKFVNNKCEVCGYVDVFAPYNFTEVLEDENVIGYALSAKDIYKSSSEDYIEYSEFIIPQEYNSKPVIEIANEAFANTAIKTVTIPASIKKIGNNAFYGSDLEEIVIPDTVTEMGYAFYRSAKLKSVKIGNGITVIAGSTFREIPSLTSVILGNSIKSIGGYAFYQSGTEKGIDKIEIPNSVNTLGDGVFMESGVKEIIMSTNVVEIPAYAFRDCIELKAFVLDNITKYNNYAFKNCMNFEAEVSLVEGMSASSTAFSNSGVKKVFYNLSSCPNDMFSGCTKLESIEFGDNVTNVKNRVLKNCSAIKSIKIGKAVNNINPNTFAGCGRGEIVVSSDNTKYSSRNNMLIQTYANGTIELAYANAAGEIPSDVTQIGGYSFYGHEGIIDLDLSDKPNLKFIGDYAFAECPNLKTVKLITNPNKGAFCINSHVFENCKTLESVYIPQKIGYLGFGILKGCSNLKNVTFEYTTGWQIKENGGSVKVSSLDVSDSSRNAEYFINDYADDYWSNLSAQNNY